MSAPGKLLALWMLTPDRKRFFYQDVINQVVVFPIWAVPCPSSGWFVRAKGVCLSWFNWWVSFAPKFQCCYFCESSCLFYLSFNSDFYVSKIMHL